MVIEIPEFIFLALNRKRTITMKLTDGQKLEIAEHLMTKSSYQDYIYVCNQIAEDDQEVIDKWKERIGVKNGNSD